MKPIRLSQICLVALALAPHSPTHAELVNYSWWDARYATPGARSYAAGGHTRQARLPDEEDVNEVTSDSVTKTNTEVASVGVFPSGSVIVDPNAYTARAQSDFGENHAETRTIITGFGESENGDYYDRRHHVMMAESIWADQWTFNGPGLGSATVTLSASFDVDISDSPCTSGDCEQVANPVFTEQGLNPWWYRLYGSVRVFDLDVIDSLIQEDSDELLDVPRQVAAFEVVQQGANEPLNFYSIEPYGSVPNARLTPVHTNGTASFVPVAGHRYAVAGWINIQSREGADVDAAHTLSLDQILVGQGLRLTSVAVTNGAQLKILDDTRVTITRTGSDEVVLSFPSAAGFTYVVESKNPMDASAWTPLATRVGDDGAQSVTNSIAGNPARWYRLRVQ